MAGTIDNQLADVGDDGRQNASDQRQYRKSDRQPAAGRPDKLHCTATVDKHAQETAGEADVGFLLISH